MKKTTVSIITLTKNRASLLEKNFQSLLEQSVKPDEIIVIDNNSVDNTQEIIKKYQKKLPIKSFVSKISGYSKLYNLGIKKASGKLICFLDDDCIAQKDWLENLVKMHLKYPTDVIQGQTFSLPKDNIYAQIMGDHYQNWLKSNMIGKNELEVLDNKNAAVSKKILEKYGGFSEKQNVGSEDLELGIRLRKNGVRIIFQPEAIVHHHERDNFKSFIKQHLRIAQSESVLDKNKKDGFKIGIFPRKKTLLNLKSGTKRQFLYLLGGQFINALRLPLIYFALFITRISGYDHS